jgi:hypothetical protein
VNRWNASRGVIRRGGYFRSWADRRRLGVAGVNCPDGDDQSWGDPHQGAGDGNLRDVNLRIAVDRRLAEADENHRSWGDHHRDAADASH